MHFSHSFIMFYSIIEKTYMTKMELENANSYL